jgi:hypothetical protein
MYPKYPIGRLIVAAMKENSIKKSVLVKAIGYQNINKGMRKLDACMAGERIHKKLLFNVGRVLEIDDQTLNEAIKKTSEEIKRKQEKYERLHFKPHIYIKHSESRPSSITIVCFAGINYFKHIELPSNIHMLSDEKQIEIVSKIINKHYKSEEGKIQMFGHITGYIYRKTYDDSIEFTVTGEVLGRSTEKFYEHKATLTVGNKTIEGGILGLRSVNDKPRK